MVAELRMEFVVLCCLFGVALSKEFVPVYIWSSREVENFSPLGGLKHLSTQDFADHFSRRLESKPLVLVFAEENLSSEDFSVGEFKKLQSLGKGTEFLPAVHNPLRALNKFSKDHSTLESVPERGIAVVTVKMDDALPDEDRHKLLRRHDSMMHEYYNRALEKRPDVVAIYTGHYTSWTEPEVHRVRRLLETSSQPNSSYLKLQTQNILLYANEMPVLNLTGNVSALQLIGEATQDIRANYESLTSKFKLNDERLEVKFFFYNSTSTTGYWSLENITVSHLSSGKPDDKLVFVPQYDIIAPNDFSYHCTSETVFRNENGTITFSNFQAQPYMDSSDSFGDAYNCELFFTAPIWSGLFVMTILAMIMIWGLIMIMDIRTMDQFDDPKGKTITISAVE